MTAPALTVESLDAGYGEVAVLRGVTLTAAAGQITAIIGANGAGKTTLMRALAEKSIAEKLVSSALLLSSEDDLVAQPVNGSSCTILSNRSANTLRGSSPLMSCKVAATPPNKPATSSPIPMKPPTPPVTLTETPTKSSTSSPSVAVPMTAPTPTVLPPTECVLVDVDFSEDAQGNKIPAGAYVESEWAEYGLSLSAG